MTAQEIKAELLKLFPDKIVSVSITDMSEGWYQIFVTFRRNNAIFGNKLEKCKELDECYKLIVEQLTKELK